MSNILVDTGEAWLIQKAFTNEIASEAANLVIGLYNDATDTITDADDFAAITTEPTTGSYGEQTVALDSTAAMSSLQEGGDWRIDIADQTFDVTNTTENVDSYYVTVQVELKGEAGASEHLLWTGSLGGTYDLSNYTSFTVQNAGLKIS